MKVIEEIGRGGFGVVEKCADEYGQLWARKTLSLDGFPQELRGRITKRFIREVKYQKSLNHPSIVKIINENLDTTPPWFTMHLAASTLDKELRNKTIDVGRFKRAVDSILNGLEEIHRNGMCHRDLKPANVLLYMDTHNEIYSISDFGFVTKDHNSTQLTYTGEGAGTEAYAAPECYTNFKKTTHLADIYSFGAILHDFFGGYCNRLPYSQHAAQGPFGPVIHRCTYKIPEERFQSVSELRDSTNFAFSQLINGVDTIDPSNIITELLQSNPPSLEQWRDLHSFLSMENETTLQHHLYKHLNDYSIISLSRTDKELFDFFTKDYAKFIMANSFPFEFCDRLADKATVFYNQADDNSKAIVAIATLEMSVKHHRYYAQNKFVDMASPLISNELAQTIIHEANRIQYPLLDNIERLLVSLSMSKGSIHRFLAERRSK